MYTHISGQTDFRRFSQFQLTSMMGFLLHRNDGGFLRKLKLAENEIAAIHECLSWGRLPGNNRCLEFFGTVFESYQNAIDSLMGRLRSVLPEGSTKCKIRATARESRDPLGSGTLMETLGEETVGMVMIDPSHVAPFRYEATQTLQDLDFLCSVYC